MKRYDVWYMKPDFFRSGVLGDRPDPTKLASTHVFLTDIQAESMEHAFVLMQGEHWSPNGEAKALIRERGLQHTSMCVGDVLIDKDNNSVWVVGMVGFNQLDNPINPT